ncbi:hypothetical protein [Morganella morganii]|uniref:hypothetical protein n=1 Tax=Morganella morganii TaxID=582 RepID=UPI0013B45F31
MITNFQYSGELCCPDILLRNSAGRGHDKGHGYRNEYQHEHGYYKHRDNQDDQGDHYYRQCLSICVTACRTIRAMSGKLPVTIQCLLHLAPQW